MKNKYGLFGSRVRNDLKFSKIKLALERNNSELYKYGFFGSGVRND